ncbi:concanavalin A-like lectin/glucanase [Ganoderma leucocontextum]|nr:concanavalin A-like lectin/glucanase [Ganoderma leucocontextum]
MTSVTSPVPRPTSPASTESNPFETPRNSLYGVITPGATSTVIAGVRPPPSSFPFQSHPGNPDPGTPLPGMARRASIDSIRAREAAHQRDSSIGTVYPPGTGAAGYDRISRSVASSGDLVGDYGRPYAPFMTSGGPMREGSITPPNPMASRVFMNSAAAAMAGSGYGNEPYLPRTQSSPAIVNMRAPFLSPASRPTSLWSPPSYVYPYPPGQSDSSFSALPRKMKPPMPSSRLSHKLSKEDKPWLEQRDWRDRASWWVTFAMIVLGAGAAGVLCFFGWSDVQMLKDSDLCMVLDENFNTLDLQNTWTRDVELGGFGNGEFQMATDSDTNLFVQDGQLYIFPTLTSDEIGQDAIFDGGSYSLDGCTTDNKTACSVKSSNGDGSTIQPVQSARISTMNSVTVAFGKVEVRAKLPRGDWLWPAIWMLPKDNAYGPWPLSGEIDIMESRGNGLSYPAQGSNFVRASLNYGVLQTVQTHLFGWWSQKRESYDQDFHIYTLEWTPSWMRFSVDSRLQSMMTVQITGKGGKDFFDRGHYPATATNGSSVAVVVDNIWHQAGGSAAAPFDQEFYLILDVAAGGTSGWFPDNEGGKPWFDGSNTAMRDFAKAQDTWAATWPSSPQDRAMRVDYVKMWKLGSC